MQLDLFVPDRFDMLERRARQKLDTIVLPVDASLRMIDSCHSDMSSAGRGAFLVFRGESGSGKSTFLHTIDLFRHDVAIASIPPGKPIAEWFRTARGHGSTLRVVIIEGREALGETSHAELETALHSINAFIRSAQGEHTLVVWPCNTDDLQDRLIAISRGLGGDALSGGYPEGYRFTGPPPETFVTIAERTLGTLNNGANLVDLGISVERAAELAKQAATIGAFMAMVRKDLNANKEAVNQLLSKEQCRMWVVVIAGNDPERVSGQGGLMISAAFPRVGPQALRAVRRAGPARRPCV